MIEKLDRAMASPAAHHVHSGTVGDLQDLTENLLKARGDYRAYKTADTVEGKIDTAEIKNAITHSQGNLDNTTRQYLGGLLTTKAGQRAIAGATDAEREAIRNAAFGSNLTNIQHYGGKFLGGGGGLGQFIASATGGGSAGTLAHLMGADPILTSAASAMGTGATMGTGMALRNMADTRTVRAAQAAADMIRKNSPEFARRAALSPAITDPRAMRDAIAYAMMGPQLKAAGQDVWNQAHVPYENRETP
jgi:hypothetical protein